MKGIAHFASGLAIASDVWLVDASATLTHAAENQRGYMGCNWLLPQSIEEPVSA